MDIVAVSADAIAKTAHEYASDYIYSHQGDRRHRRCFSITAACIATMKLYYGSLARTENDKATLA